MVRGVVHAQRLCEMGGIGHLATLLRRNQVDVGGVVLDGQPQHHLERRRILHRVVGQPVGPPDRNGVSVPALRRCDAGRLSELDVRQVVPIVRVRKAVYQDVPAACRRDDPQMVQRSPAAQQRLTAGAIGVHQVIGIEEQP